MLPTDPTYFPGTVQVSLQNVQRLKSPGDSNQISNLPYEKSCLEDGLLGSLDTVVKIIPPFFFGHEKANLDMGERGPDPCRGRKLTTYPSPGMILQVAVMYFQIRNL